MDPIREQLTDLGEITLVALAALAFGLLFVRLKLPPIVGYISAGILLGPTGLGFVGQSNAVVMLAELGVLLLLFLIGMELSVRAFVYVLKPAVIIVIGQLAASLALTFTFSILLDWNAQQALLLGFIFAVSSTAVAIKILEDIDELRTEIGRITVGVMIAQDIAIVPMLILAEGLDQDSTPGMSVFLLIALSAGILFLLIWYLNEPGKIRLPFSKQLTGRPEMIALAALTFCFSAATLSSLLGVSPAYGAFVAGLVVSNSTMRAEAIEVTYPIQSILILVFFLSIGLLIDLEFVAENWKAVLGFVTVLTVTKTVLNVLLIRVTGSEWLTALPAGLAMAQIGEFSFILAAVGFRNGVLDVDTYRLSLSVIVVSLMISPIWMIVIRRVHAMAALGITNLREALAEIYSIELPTAEDGQDIVPGLLHRSRLYARAGRRALSRRKAKNRPKQIPTRVEK